MNQIEQSFEEPAPEDVTPEHFTMPSPRLLSAEDSASIAESIRVLCHFKVISRQEEKEWLAGTPPDQ